MFYNLIYPLSHHVEVLNVLGYLTVRMAAALATALILSLVLGPRMIARFRRIQAGYKTVREDVPENHLAKSGTPTMGGVLILVALVSSTLLWADLRDPYIWLTLGVVVGYGLVGFADDYLKATRIRPKGVPGKVRLLIGSLLGAAAITYMGEVMHAPHLYDVFVPFLKNLYIPLGVFGFTVFGILVLVGSANAVNLTDGLDGLATVPTMITAGSFALICYVVGRPDYSQYLFIHHVPGASELAVFCAALVGACMGFLWYNCPPARIFMGDTGSLTLGSSLGMVAIVTKNEIVLAIIGGLFVIETLSVIIQVASFKLTGKRVFRMAPLHHHFEKAGWPESTIVVRFWIISILFALLGLATFKLR